MAIITAIEAAKRWNITERHMTWLIRNGRIEGAYKIGQSWVIPADTQKPDNSRKKKRYATSPGLMQILSLQSLFSDKELMQKILDMLPTPIEIFAPDGLLIYANRAYFDMNGITDPSVHIGHYNLKTDPVCNDALGMRDGIQQAFRGGYYAWKDFSPPIQDLVDRGEIEEKPYELAFTDVSLNPLFRDGELAYVVCVYIVKGVYKGKLEIAKAMEYIDKNWFAEFSRDKIAKAVHISPRHFTRTFKKYYNTSPQDYYKKVKVEKIQEKLRDPNISVKQAFADCGVDSRGVYTRHFKDITGMTPGEYQNEQAKS